MPSGAVNSRTPQCVRLRRGGLRPGGGAEKTDDRGPPRRRGPRAPWRSGARRASGTRSAAARVVRTQTTAGGPCRPPRGSACPQRRPRSSGTWTGRRVHAATTRTATVRRANRLKKKTGQNRRCHSLLVKDLVPPPAEHHRRRPKVHRGRTSGTEARRSRHEGTRGVRAPTWVTADQKRGCQLDRPFVEHFAEKPAPRGSKPGYSSETALSEPRGCREAYDVRRARARARGSSTTVATTKGGSRMFEGC